MYKFYSYPHLKNPVGETVCKGEFKLMVVNSESNLEFKLNSSEILSVNFKFICDSTSILSDETQT